MLLSVNGVYCPLFYFNLCLKICQRNIFYWWHFLWCYFCFQNKFGVLNSEYQLIVFLKKVSILMMDLIVLILIVLLYSCFLYYNLIVRRSVMYSYSSLRYKIGFLKSFGMFASKHNGDVLVLWSMNSFAFAEGDHGDLLPCNGVDEFLSKQKSNYK